MQDMRKVESSIAVLEEQFPTQPTEVLRQLKEYSRTSREEFLAQTIDYLAESEDSRFSKLVFHQMREDDADLEGMLFRSLAIPNEKMLRIAALAARIEPRLPAAWTATLNDELQQWQEEDSLAPILRKMQAISHTVDPLRRITVLNPATKHADARIRAKAVALINTALGEEQMPFGIEDVSSRVRATAIESMWGRRDALVREQFERHLRAKSPREAINAALGLHRAGKFQARQSLMSWAEGNDGHFGRAAVWATGQTEDPRLLVFLQQKMRSVDSSLRGHVLRALKRLREFRESAALAERLQFKVQTMEMQGLNRMRILLSITKSNGQPFPIGALQPTNFLIEDGSQIHDQARIRFTGSETPAVYLLLLPLQTSDIVQSKLEDLVQSKRREDVISIQRYPAGSSTTAAVCSSIDFCQTVEAGLGLAKSSRIAATNWQNAIERSIASFPGRLERRHLLVVTDASWGADAEASASWAERARRFDVSFHLLARHRIRAACANSWRRLCHQTNGSFAECLAPVDLPESLDRWLLDMLCGVEITCDLVPLSATEAGKQDRLRIEAVSRHGWGFLELDLQAAGRNWR